MNERTESKPQQGVSMSDVHVSPHPLVQHKLTLLRRTVTEPKKFRELVRELTQFLLYEATLDLPLNDRPIETPLAPLVGKQIGVQIGLVPILRADRKSTRLNSSHANISYAV